MASSTGPWSVSVSQAKRWERHLTHFLEATTHPRLSTALLVYTFKNFDNWLGTWALEGQGMYYGAKPMQKPGEDTSYPAIIDTGSSQLSIPPDVFEKIRSEWQQALPNLDCTSD